MCYTGLQVYIYGCIIGSVSVLDECNSSHSQCCQTTKGAFLCTPKRPFGVINRPFCQFSNLGIDKTAEISLLEGVKRPFGHRLVAKRNLNLIRALPTLLDLRYCSKLSKTLEKIDIVRTRPQRWTKCDSV